MALAATALTDLHAGAPTALTLPAYSGRAPAGAVLPYAVYGDGGESRGRSFGPSAAGDDTIMLLAAGPGYRGAKRFYARVASLLNSYILTLANGAKIRGRYEMVSVADDPGDPTGLTVRLVGRYQWTMISAPTS